MTEYFGIKVATIIAGFVGAIVSLAYIKGLTRGKAFITLLAGTFSAGYFTTPAVAWAGLSEQWENGAAFIIGVIGMNILAGLFKVSENFSQRPVQTINELRGKKDD